MESHAREVADVLGLPRQRSVSNYDLAQLFTKGLATTVLFRVCDLLAPEDKSLPGLLIPRATLKRRQQQKVLSPAESELLGRLAEVWAMAMDVYKDEQSARRFLLAPHPLLHGKRPFDLARANAFGADAVMEILGRLKYGSAA